MRAPTPPVDVPRPERASSTDTVKMPAVRKTKPKGSTGRSVPHDSSALPPAVAALLAVTQIPRPKPNQFRRRPAVSNRRVSIDELVSEWKSEESLGASYSTSPALSMLLEDQEAEETAGLENEDAEEDYLNTRSTSLESLPSLEDDDKSVISNSSLPTPKSLRSRRSISNLKRDNSRSLTASVECVSNHPLVPRLETRDEDLDILNIPGIKRASPPKAKSSLKSNLTTSLQTLKNAALNSITSLNIGAVSPSQRTPSTPLSDDTLWSHPFLFPRFTAEVRPTIDGTPTEAQRRYLNPVPLTFEEQEAPYQQALHAPFLAEPVEGATLIQMQTYNRGRRKTAKRGSSPDPQSEAGRALTGAVGVRQREPRENSDFLRVVVLEMNMRRVGKLEYGKAKIWLPPRQTSPSPESEGRVPQRWKGQSAY